MNAHSVPKVFSRNEQAHYRNAVSAMFNDIKRDTGLSWERLADKLDISVGTVYAARDKLSDLSGLYLIRVGFVFGGSYLNPVLALFGVQATSIEKKPSTDVLPLVAKVNLEIAKARDPNGLGGAIEVPQERRAYLPDLKAMQREVGCLIAEIESI